MKIIVLGSGVGAAITCVVLKRKLQNPDITVISNVPWTFDTAAPPAGLHYLHAPTEYEISEDSIYNWIPDKGFIKHRWGITTSNGLVIPYDLESSPTLLNSIVDNYARRTFREKSSSTMNSVIDKKGEFNIAASLHHRLKWNDLMSLLKAELIKNKIFTSIKIANIKSINIDYKEILMQGELLKYDVIISTVPSYAFTDYVSKDLTKSINFTLIPSYYVSMDYEDAYIPLDYFYNTRPSIQPEFHHLSRVTNNMGYRRTNGRLDYEFALSPKFDKKETMYFKDTVAFFNDFLNETFGAYEDVDIKFTYVTDAMNPYAHFLPNEKVVKELIPMFESKDIFQLGRYAQWDSKVKIVEMWNRALELAKYIKQ